MAAVATTAFAVMPRSFNWMIGGGGITRSLGFLLAVVAIAMVTRSARTRSIGWALGSGIALGLSALSHPQAPIFAVASLVALVVTNAAGMRRAWLSLTIVGTSAAIVVLPWLLLVVSRHGLTTLSGAAATGGSFTDAVLMFFSFRFSDGQFEVLGFIGAFGLFVCVLNRFWLWPLWTALILVAGSRAGFSYATLPVSGAIAYAVADGLRLLGLTASSTAPDLRGRPRLVLVLGLVLLLAVAD